VVASKHVSTVPWLHSSEEVITFKHVLFFSKEVIPLEHVLWPEVVASQQVESFSWLKQLSDLVVTFRCR